MDEKTFAKFEQDIVLAKMKPDSEALGIYTGSFINQFYPSYCISDASARNLSQEDSLDKLNSFTFYRICECNICNVENRLEYFSTKMQKLFSTAYAIQQEVCYGIVSSRGKTALVLGVQPTSDDQKILSIMEGLLPGIKLERYTEHFENVKSAGIEKDRYVGCISGVPALRVDGKLQSKDLSSMMRSLNGQDYTVMVLCKPLDIQTIQAKIDQAVTIKDACFAISKRTVSKQMGESKADSNTTNHSDSNATTKTKQSGFQISAALPGLLSGAAAGAALGTPIPIAGNLVGAVGGGLIGLIVGKHVSLNKGRSNSKTHTVTEGYSQAVTNTISNSDGISGEIQNGFAIELMKMSETLIERLKSGRSIGMWESVVTYSSDSKCAHDIIQGSLYSEIASGVPDILPPVIFSYEDSANRMDLSKNNQQLMIPKGFFEGPCDSPLCSLVTSEELCGICTIPTENIVGFEINESRDYAINYHMRPEDQKIGCVCEYDRPIPNVPFGLSEADLNRHTFVCGITGSGKTNTVKKILQSIDKPFLVIEPAKKEYRNIQKQVTVYTMGRPEINCPKINPFYILPGVSPQQHIDLLKDLFSASFAFYGPMPYILEKCLYNIYAKRGWNLTMGFHPKLIHSQNPEALFDDEILQKQYKSRAHRYVFPTMQDLKDEVDHYIETEMPYEGEVKGNIRGAIKARIESLCVGSKGYMFNTHEMVNLPKLLQNNTIIELEGLADDADKAFALGLLLIYINEYREVRSEVEHINSLQHLLVIEEAHRLLKNVSTENNEDLGNPKGKAVEHFTKMLAEMRSYGQGVIVAEQIPSKLAPDVIKNSSNKIIHRLVAKDDQEQIANTIGVYPEDAIGLGVQKVGYALCHKEGMVQPVVVKIDSVESNCVRDVRLYHSNLEDKMLQINQSILESHLSTEIYLWAVKTLVSLLYHPKEEIIYDGLDKACETILKKADICSIALIPGTDKKRCVRSCILDEIITMMVAGAFSGRILPNEELVIQLECTLQNPEQSSVDKLTWQMSRFYERTTENEAVKTVARLLAGESYTDIVLRKIINEYCLLPSDDFCEDVFECLRKGEY